MLVSDNYMITGGDPTDKTLFLSRLHERLKSGVKFIQLRAKQLSDHDYKVLAAEAMMLCRIYDATLLLNCDVKLVETLNADGIQLTSKRLMACQKRPLDRDLWVGASCHNEQELQHAEKIGVDFVTLSPVLPTATHPDATPIGWDNFNKWVQKISIPVYALGGVGQEDMMEAKKHGAAGVAAIRAFWGFDRRK